MNLMILGIGTVGIRVSEKLRSHMPKARFIFVTSDGATIKKADNQTLVVSYKQIERVYSAIKNTDPDSETNIVMIHSLTGLSGSSMSLEIIRRINKMSSLNKIICISFLPVHIGNGPHAKKSIQEFLDYGVDIIHGFLFVDNHSLILNGFKDMEEINNKIASLLIALFSDENSLIDELFSDQDKLALVMISDKPGASVTRKTRRALVSKNITPSMGIRHGTLPDSVKSTIVVTGDCVYDVCLNYWTQN